MANELLESLFGVNLAIAGAVGIILFARPMLRRLAGPRIAYLLWLLVPFAALGSLLPPRKIVAFLPESSAPERTRGYAGSLIADAGTVELPASAILFPGWPPVLIAIWIAGVAAGIGWLVWKQRRFMHQIGRVSCEQGRVKALASGVGPAVVGVLAPKILLPTDFSQRFSPREQDVILAHEEYHLAQGHAQTNALVLLCQCVNWFNPALHAAARALRLDQELACDAAVMARFPNARRSYAEAMLKTQIAPADLLLGCYWPAKGSALLQRLLMLEAPRPSRVRVGLGLAVTVALATIAGLGAWATQPAETVVVRTAPAETPLSVKQGWSPGDTARNSQAVSGPKMLGLEPFGQGESPAASASDVAVVEQSPALVAPRASAPDLGLWSGALFSQIQTEQPAAVARASMREAADDDDAQREVGWIGGERLVVRVGGEVTYYQSQRSIIVLRGRQADIERVTIRDGLIEYDDAGRDRRPVDVEIYAPSMRHLTVVGARELNIERFDQESLELVLTHVGDTEAEGRVGTLHVQTTGDGRVDLEKLRAGAAHVVNGGDGRVSLAARELADITISGRGDVALTTQPASVVGRGQGKGVIRYPKTLAVDRPPERIKGRPGASLPARAPPNSA